MFYGCGTMVFLFLVLAMMYFVGVTQLKRFADHVTSPEAAPLPPLAFTQGEKAQMRARLSAFAHALTEGKTSDPLVLGGNDLNLLLASTDQFNHMADHVRFRIDEGEVRAELSIPFGDLGSPRYRDRYFNGEGVVKVKVENGKLVVFLDELSVHGRALSKPYHQYLQAIRAINYAQSVNDDPEISAVLERLAAIEIKGSTLTVVPQ